MSCNTGVAHGSLGLILQSAVRNELMIIRANIR